MAPFWRDALKATFAVAVCLLACTGTAQAETAKHAVHVRGSTTFLPLAQRVAELYMEANPGTIVAVSGGGTSRGYKSIMDGTADVGLASGTIPRDLKKEMDRRGTKPVVATAAYIALAPVVHPSNPLATLRQDQLRGIFTGRIQNWKDLGGRDAQINVLVGPPTGGLTEAWKSRVIGENNTYTPKALVIDSAARVARVAADPFAITFAAFDDIVKNVKTLKINGISATRQTVGSGEYPWRTSLMLVSAENASDSTKDFIRFFTAQHKDIHLTGIVPVDPANEPGQKHE